MITGYKIFNPDWTCRGMKYTCPGVFEMYGSPVLCERGFHFCKKLEDCLKYYRDADAFYHFAEVIAHGEVVESDDDSKCCTNKIEIIRELPFEEVLKLVNTGKHNTGYSNTGSYNTGNSNSGNKNSGSYNTGYGNTGDVNTGDRNTGSYNTGNYNTGNYNSGSCNIGNSNTGNNNIGYRNTGDYNAGDRNSGRLNAGNGNNGNKNSGSYNIGHYNAGDWNIGSYNVGCFNTNDSAYITLFNKPTDWTLDRWFISKARAIMSRCPSNKIKTITLADMTPEELAEHPEAKIVGDYDKIISYIELVKERQVWWDELPNYDRNEVMSLPNFDADIFKRCTGIEVRNNDEKH